MIRFERALDKTLARLEERWRLLTPDMDWSHHDGDDVESIASSSLPTSVSTRRFHFVSGGREAERLKRKVITLERENQTMKSEVDQMKEVLRQHGITIEQPDYGEDNKDADPVDRPASLDEKDVWKLLVQHRK